MQDHARSDGGVREPASGDWFKTLSTDAKLILGAHFGMMITPGKGSVTFHTPWNRTPRAVAAFDELVSAGILSVEDGSEGRWARTYRARVNCSDSFKWMMRNSAKGKGFTVMVPDADRSERPPRGWEAADAGAASPADRLATKDPTNV